MNCEQAKGHLPDYWATSLDDGTRRSLEAHFDECASCREEAAHLEATLNSLESLPEERPSAAMRARFEQMLDVYMQGQKLPIPVTRRTSWALRPSWQVAALAASVFVAGLLVGGFVNRGKQQTQEVSHLREEIQNMRQLVTLSLLQQQSAGERLRGVNWSVRVDQPDTEVISALLDTVNRDPNVNVRLAAIDALRNFSTNSVVRKAIAPSISEQESPLVQFALIDLLADLRDSQSAGALRKLAQNEQFLPEVRERARAAVRKLE